MSPAAGATRTLGTAGNGNLVGLQRQADPPEANCTPSSAVSAAATTTTTAASSQVRSTGTTGGLRGAVTAIATGPTRAPLGP